MLKKDIEALLFSAGRKLSIEELSHLARSSPEEIKSALAELKMEYDEKSSSLMLANEGDFWKLAVREPFLPLVRKIVTETELSKTILETLAVIAFKYPIKQSDLIKIRTNKAYDHLKELEEMGYITRQKHGRTNLIKLTQRFFEYFDLPEEKVKEVFSDFSSIAKAIEEKEAEVKRVKEEQHAMAGEEKKKQEQMAKGIELEAYGQDEQKETKENEPATASQLTSEGKLGSLEIVNEPSEEELEKESERLQQIKEEGNMEIEEKEPAKAEEPPEEGMELSSEEQKLVDDRVKTILHPKGENEENAKSQTQEGHHESSEEKDLLEAEMEEEKRNKTAREK